MGKRVKVERNKKYSSMKMDQEDKKYSEARLLLIGFAPSCHAFIITVINLRAA